MLLPQALGPQAQALGEGVAPQEQEAFLLESRTQRGFHPPPPIPTPRACPLSSELPWPMLDPITSPSSGWFPAEGQALAQINVSKVKSESLSVMSDSL